MEVFEYYLETREHEDEIGRQELGDDFFELEKEFKQLMNEKEYEEIHFEQP